MKNPVNQMFTGFCY